MENNNSTQSIIKKAKHDSKFAQISNDLINNRNLSYKSLGILTYILSKPDDWTVYISDLIRDDKDGEKSVRSGINELIANKYMQRYRVYDADTKKVHHWETLVSEIPFYDDNLISIVKERYLKDSDGNKVYQKIKFGDFERVTPIVLEREVELLSQKGKVGAKKLLSQNVQVGKVEVGNEGQQILITTDTDLNQNLNSSSSSSISAKTYFEVNICKLTEITRVKFNDLIENIDNEMVLAVIEECTTTKVTSYKGFEVAFNSYVERGCKTKYDVIKAAEEFRTAKKKSRNKQKFVTKEKTNNLRFNNFEAREKSERYQYLEEQCLLGQASEEEKREFDEMRGIINN